MGAEPPTDATGGNPWSFKILPWHVEREGHSCRGVDPCHALQHPHEPLVFAHCSYSPATATAATAATAAAAAAARERYVRGRLGAFECDGVITKKKRTSAESESRRPPHPPVPSSRISVAKGVSLILFSWLVLAYRVQLIRHHANIATKCGWPFSWKLVLLAVFPC